MDDLSEAETPAKTAERLLHGSSFGAAAPAYAEHRPGYAGLTGITLAATFLASVVQPGFGALTDKYRNLGWRRSGRSPTSGSRRCWPCSPSAISIRAPRSARQP